VDVEALDEVFLDFSKGRIAQKRKYFGEFFPAQMPEGASGRVFLEFFQTDKETGRSKGIVGLILKEAGL
jgi:hypothetical protein